MTRLRYAEDNMLSRLARIPERDRQTDGRADGQNCYINIVLTHTTLFAIKGSNKKNCKNTYEHENETIGFVTGRTLQVS